MLPMRNTVVAWGWTYENKDKIDYKWVLNGHTPITEYSLAKAPDRRKHRKWLNCHIQVNVICRRQYLQRLIYLRAQNCSTCLHVKKVVSELFLIFRCLLEQANECDDIENSWETKQKPLREQNWVLQLKWHIKWIHLVVVKITSKIFIENCAYDGFSSNICTCFRFFLTCFIIYDILWEIASCIHVHF